jgi:hypothetical protein
LIPLSREVGRLTTIKRDLALYRLVFGQPRQQDLLAFLAQGDRSAEMLDVRVSLEPPAAGP